MPVNTSPILAFRCLCMVDGNEEISHKNSFGNGKNGRVCNIFQQPFSVGFGLPKAVVNGLRMASEATTPCFAPKYRKIGNRGIFATFPAGKPETSDFFATKYGGFASKVRMFLSKKSDVFEPKYGILRHFLPCFFSFLPQNLMNSAEIHTLRYYRIDNIGLQNA